MSTTNVKKWVIPDWAPSDAGDILIRDGDWILIKDYMMSDRSPVTAAVHLCEGQPWVLHENPPAIKDGKCDHCGAIPPDAFLGFARLAAWDR